MATDSELLDLIDDLLGDGSAVVLKENHQPLLNAIVESLLNKTDDANLLGLLQHNPGRPYKEGEGVFKDGQLWQSKEDIAIEPWNVSKWTQITGLTSLSDYNIPEWEENFPSGSGGGYPEDFQVKRDDRLWESDSDANTEDPLNGGWTEISANDGKFGNDWVVGVYKTNQVVTNPNDKKLYYLSLIVPASGYSSSDIDVEIAAGDWTLFHDLTSGDVVLSVETTDNLFSELLDTSGNSFPIENNTLEIISFKISAFQTGGISGVVGDSFSREYLFTLINSDNVVSIQNDSITEFSLFDNERTVEWILKFTPDSGFLKIEVRGANDLSISWKGTVSTLNKINF